MAAPPAFGRPGWGRAHPQGRRRDGRFAPCAFAPRSPLLDGRCAPVGIVGVAPFVGLAALAASPALEGLRPGVATLRRGPWFTGFRFPAVVFSAEQLRGKSPSSLPSPTPSKKDDMHMQNTKPNKIVAALRRSRESQKNPNPRVETVLDAARRAAYQKKDQK